MKVANCPKLTASGEISFQKSKLKKAEFFSARSSKSSGMNFPQIFSFPKKMELEKREKHEKLLNQIIYWEGQIIGAHNDYMERKNKCESEIKRIYEHITCSERMEFLKKRGLEWSCPADDILCREESEKELQRWKNLAPGEKIREHREEISKLENEEDWEVNDIQVDRWIEAELEKD